MKRFTILFLSLFFVIQTGLSQNYTVSIVPIDVWYDYSKENFGIWLKAIIYKNGAEMPPSSDYYYQWHEYYLNGWHIQEGFALDSIFRETIIKDVYKAYVVATDSANHTFQGIYSDIVGPYTIDTTGQSVLFNAFDENGTNLLDVTPYHWRPTINQWKEGYKGFLRLGYSEKIKTSPDFLLALQQKFHFWDNDIANISNYNDFFIDNLFNEIKARYDSAYSRVNVTDFLISANLKDKDSLFIRDPWLVDTTDSRFYTYPYGYHNLGSDTFFIKEKTPITFSFTSKFKGVFLNQNETFNPNIPVYSVRAPMEQQLTVNGKNITWYFQRWDGNHVQFQSPDQNETAVVFEADGAEARAVYKGHLASSTPLALAYNNGRRLVMDSNGRYHLAYVDAGEIYYTYSDDGGSTWAEEIKISNSGGTARYPSIAVDGENNYHIVWQEDDPLNGYGVHYKPSGGNEQVLGYSTSSSAMPVITAKGILHKRVVVWQSGNRLKLKLINDDIGTWRETTVPNTDGNCLYPSMADDGSASYATHMVWQKNGQIYYQNMHYNYDAEADEVIFSWRHYGSLSSGYATITDHRHPCVVVSQDRKPEVVWDAYDEENEAGGRAVLHRRKTSTYSNSWSMLTEFFDDRSSEFPSVGKKSGSDNLTVVWRYNPSSAQIYGWNRVDGVWGSIQILASGEYPGIVPQGSGLRLAYRSRTGTPYTLGTRSSGLAKTAGFTLLVSRREDRALSALFQEANLKGSISLQAGPVWLEWNGKSSIIPFVAFPDSIQEEELLATEEFSVPSGGKIHVPYRMSFLGIGSNERISPSLLERELAVVHLVDAGTGTELERGIAPRLMDIMASGKDTVLLKGEWTADLDRLNGRRVIFVAQFSGKGSGRRWISEIYRRSPGISKPGGKFMSQQAALMPASFKMFANYPNPFNLSTVIRYQLPERAQVSLAIYNLRGREVARLVEEVQPAGGHQVRWEARGLPSGVYFCQLEARSLDGGKSFSAVHKLALVR